MNEYKKDFSIKIDGTTYKLEENIGENNNNIRNDNELNYLIKSEYLHKLSCDYIKNKQVKMTLKHRELIINWMMESHAQLELLPEILILASHIFDRTLAKSNIIPLEEFHLYAIGSLMIAAKFSESQITIHDLQIVSGGAYTQLDILSVERLILKVLNYSLNIPGPLHFLYYYSKDIKLDDITNIMAQYICELSITSYKLIFYPPSYIAISSIYIANIIINNLSESNEPIFLHYHSSMSNINIQDLIPCIKLLKIVINKTFNAKSGAIYRKYSNPENYSVSYIKPVYSYSSSSSTKINSKESSCYLYHSNANCDSSLNRMKYINAN